MVNLLFPFKIIYSFYEHQYLQNIVAAFAIQLLDDGSYSSIYQSITSENIKEFQPYLKPEDIHLIELCSEIHPKVVIKAFGGDYRKAPEFFKAKFADPKSKVVETILLYMQKRMANLLVELKDSPLFEMSQDDIPHAKPIQYLAEKGTVMFNFQRKPEHTLYYISIKLRDKFLTLTHKKARIICNYPAWILLNGELFTFKDDIEGKKMQPFLQKFNIEVPKNREQEYYEKFIGQVIEKYEVRVEGFEIRKVLIPPTFHFYISYNETQGFSFKKEVHYGENMLPIDENKKDLSRKSVLHKEGDKFIFDKILRDSDKEQQIKDLLKEINPNKESFLSWEALPKNIALNWLPENVAKLVEAGFIIHQDTKQINYLLEIPQLDINTKANGDWFDIQAIVKIGEYEIPFVQFRNHILRNQREYALPDGSIAILPETWFANYTNLVKLADVKNQQFTIHRRDIALVEVDEEEGISMKWKKESDEVPTCAPPQNLKAELRKYQQEGYEWLRYMRSNGRGAILADDMGLGKTLQALAFLLKEKEDGIKTPSLVVMPTSLIFNWLSEAKKFTPDLRVTVHTGSSRSKNAQSFAFFDVVLTTYGIARIDVEMLQKFDFHYIILDESQMIKNAESKVAQAVKELKSQFKLSLTGTPIENSVMDIGSQMQFLNPILFERLFGSENNFKKTYAAQIEKQGDKKKLQELRKVVQHFIKRRKKEQVATELPPKIEQLHYCEMSEKQAKLYEETRDAYRNYLLNLIQDGGFSRNKLNVLAGLQKIRQIAIHPQLIEENGKGIESGKYEEVKRLLNEIIAEDSKVLIFSQFVKMLQILKNDLTMEKVPFVYLDGSTPEKERKKNVDTFQNDPNIKVFLISLKAGGVGLNLTAAEYVFIIDPWWNPAVEQQAIDRAHRIGQEKTVFYYKFISRDTIEEKIIALQKRKSSLSDSLIEEELFQGMDEEDVKWLVEG